MATNNILTARVTIRGLRPLIQHKFGPDALPLEKQEKTGVAGNDPQEWRKTCMVNPEGQLFLPPEYIFATITQGAKHTARKRGTLQPFVAATLQVTDDTILLDRYFPGFPNGHSFDVKTAEPPTDDQTAPVFMHICGVKNPATKARNVRYRIAANTGWTATFNLMWDKTIVSRGEMEAAVIDAGRFTGLADGRSVGYGRFQVQEFHVNE